VRASHVPLAHRRVGRRGRVYELDAVFAFHLCGGFLLQSGFHGGERGALPLKAWKDCIRCPKFQACDEVAMVAFSAPDRSVEPPPPLRVDSAGSADDQLIRIPGTANPLAHLRPGGTPKVGIPTGPRKKFAQIVVLLNTFSVKSA